MALGIDIITIKFDLRNFVNNPTDFNGINLTEKVAFVYSYWTPELEVRGSKSYSTKKIKAMKALRYEGAVFMAFCF